MRIVQLTAENIKRLKAVSITPKGDIVTISGKNGAGKSSTLDAIAMAIGGKELVPDKPIRTGAAKAFTEVDLGDYVVRRTFTAGGGTSLVVKAKDGTTVKSPQALLDGLIGKLSFDPLAFARLKPGDQQEALRRIVKLDTSALDAERELVFAQRTDVNRTLKAIDAQLKGAAWIDGAPTDEVSITDLVGQLAQADQALAESEQLRRTFDAAAAKWKEARDHVETFEKRIAALRAEIAKCEEEIRLASAAKDKLKPEVIAARDAHSAALAALPDRPAIRQRMTDADAINAQVRANKRIAELAEKAGAAKLEFSRLGDQIDAIDQQRADLIAAAPYPIPGLTFDASGAILFNREPFSQASTAEQLRVSVAIGAALNPTLRVLLVRNGNDLDAESLAKLAQFAAEHDAQVWIERVSESADGVSVLIEDGEVAEPKAAGLPMGVHRPVLNAQQELTLRSRTFANTSETHAGFLDVNGKRNLIEVGKRLTLQLAGSDQVAMSKYIEEVAS